VTNLKARICVIQFPGVNCEYETAMALDSAGLGADIVRWNDSGARLADYDGFVLPGGFSYQDRVRAGAIAAADDIIGCLIDQAGIGKPVLGICNGAQILVEAGMVPGIVPGQIDIALAPNRGMGRGGYYASWVFVKVPPAGGPGFISRRIEPGGVLPMSVAHAEGRFVSADAGLFDTLERNGQIVLQYCRHDGSMPAGFPDDPDGSARFAAAVCNPRGNVVAMMPHPERSAWLRQVPPDIASTWAVRRVAATGCRESMEGVGPGATVFESMRAYIEAGS
jgi:phosphoribosylformylglycinamidine synthase I